MLGFFVLFHAIKFFIVFIVIYFKKKLKVIL